MSRVLEPRHFEEALAWVERWPLSMQEERLPLGGAAGRVVLRALPAPEDIPAAARSAREGYAVQAADTIGAGDYNPLPLRLQCTAGSIERGRAHWVRHGDLLPAGADAVVASEWAERHGGTLEVMSALAPGDGVLLPGVERRQGEALVQAGRRLRPQDLALLALGRVSEVGVHRLVRVRVVLAARSAKDALKPMLLALIARDGGALLPPDEPINESDLIRALREPEADLILIAGGTGYEEDDSSMRALQSCGEIDMDGVAIQPGTGTVLGQVGSVPVVLLPGTPLACLSAYDLIAARLLCRLGGKRTLSPYHRRTMQLRRKITSTIGRLELARVAVDGDRAEPIATAEGRILSTAVTADGFVLIPEQSEGYPQGSMVDVHLYDEFD